MSPAQSSLFFFSIGSEFAGTSPQTGSSSKHPDGLEKDVAQLLSDNIAPANKMQNIKKAENTV